MNPVTYDVPAAGAEQSDGERGREERCQGGHDHEEDTGADDGEVEDGLTRQALLEKQQPDHSDGSAEPECAHHDAVGRGIAAQSLLRVRRPQRDHGPGTDHAHTQPDDHAANPRLVRDVGKALFDLTRGVGKLDGLAGRLTANVGSEAATR